jgi:hypothetical protein
MAALMTRLFKSPKVRYFYSIAKAGIHIGFPALLLWLPATFFDHGRSISLFELAGVEDYYSKGITRAIMHLIHFDFATAWEYNKLSFVVFPLIAYVWGKAFLQNFFLLKKLHQQQKTTGLPQA